MTRSTRSRCSLWAQQGSNLRPLGEQRSYDQGRNSPIDLAEQGSRYDQNRPVSTPLVDAKWTADHGRSLVSRVLVFQHAGVKLTPGTASPLGSVGAGVA